MGALESHPEGRRMLKFCCSPPSLSPASNHPKPKPKPKPGAPDGWRWRRVPGRISIRNPGWHRCLWQNGRGNGGNGENEATLLVNQALAGSLDKISPTMSICFFDLTNSKYVDFGMPLPSAYQE